VSIWPRLVALAGIWAVVVISPGPDFVVTVSHAARSWRAGLAAAAGIVAGTAIWASVSAVGLEVVFAHYRWVADVVRLLGAGYLAWLGARMIIRARRPLPAAAAPGSPARPGPSWPAGLLADLGNRKAAVFWTSLFAVVLPAGAPTWMRVLAIVVVVVACTFSLAAVTSAYQRAKKWIDRGTGGVLIGLAARLTTEH
jgi:threonine/homoserine/homoserine lactone efflux protein